MKRCSLLMYGLILGILAGCDGADSLSGSSSQQASSQSSEHNDAKEAALVELERHLALWQSSKPATFAYSLAAAHGNYRVSFEADEYISQFYGDFSTPIDSALGSGAEANQTFTEIDSVFANLQQQITAGAPVAVEYDPNFGLPLKYTLAGETYRIVDFSDGLQPIDKYYQARMRWQMADIQSYYQFVAFSCNCDLAGRITVKVVDDAVTQVLSLSQEGAASTQLRDQYTRSINAIFDAIYRDLQLGNDYRVEYDEQTGRPINANFTLRTELEELVVGFRESYFRAMSEAQRDLEAAAELCRSGDECEQPLFDTQRDERSHFIKRWFERLPEAYSYTARQEKGQTVLRMVFDGFNYSYHDISAIDTYLATNIGRVTSPSNFYIDSLYSGINQELSENKYVDAIYNPDYGFPEYIWVRRGHQYDVFDFSPAGGPFDKFYKGQLNWLDKRIYYYNATVEIDCDCEWAGTFDIQVKNAELLAVSAAGSGQSLDLQSLADLPLRVDDIFKLILKSLKEGDLVDANYDERTGMPTHFQRMKQGEHGDLLSIAVTNFREWNSQESLKNGYQRKTWLENAPALYAYTYEVNDAGEAQVGGRVQVTGDNVLQMATTGQLLNNTSVSGMESRFDWVDRLATGDSADWEVIYNEQWGYPEVIREGSLTSAVTNFDLSFMPIQRELIEINEAKWQQYHLLDYSAQVISGCRDLENIVSDAITCEQLNQGGLLLYVLDKNVQLLESDNGGVQMGEGSAVDSGVLTYLSALMVEPFQFLNALFDQSSSMPEVSYDPKYGFPLTININSQEQLESGLSIFLHDFGVGEYSIRPDR